MTELSTPPSDKSHSDLLCYDGSVGELNRDAYARFVTDLIFAGTFGPPGSKFTQGDAAKKLLKMKQWKGPDGKTDLFRWVRKDGSDNSGAAPKDAEKARSAMGQPFQLLSERGIIRQEPAGGSFRIPKLGKEEVRALLTTRDTLDKLVALRLMTSDGAPTVLTLEAAGTELANQANHCREVARFLDDDYAAKLRNGNSREEAVFHLAVLRMRFVRSDARMHAALAEGLNLDHLTRLIETSHMLPDLHFVGLTARDLRPETKMGEADFDAHVGTARNAVKMMGEVVTQHEQILDALKAIKTGRKAPRSSLVRVDEALRHHLSGTFEHWAAAGIAENTIGLTEDRLVTLVLPASMKGRTKTADLVAKTPRVDGAGG